MIGILGGMGPEATAELYMKLIRSYQVEGAKYDADFPKMHIINLPVPDMVENESEGIKESIVLGIRQLESSGADIIAIPCNTAMHYAEGIRTRARLVDITEATREDARRRGLKKPGLLGTETTIREGLYGDTINPDEKEREEITRIIMRVLSGKKLREDRERLVEIGNRLKERGADDVILGCTELSLLLKDRFIDSLDCLAKKVRRIS
ncbi:MAG: aspartate/glutamate racemase family protein [Nanobdellota archaeon]